MMMRPAPLPPSMALLLALWLALPLVVPGAGFAAPAAGPAGSLDWGTDEVPVLFARCAGRLGAEETHGWLTGAPGGAARRGARQAMEELLQAAADPAAGPDAVAHLLALKVEAKLAQRALLERAQFSRDPVEASRAGRLAHVLLAPCLAALGG